MKRIKNFLAFFEGKTNESFSSKEGGVYYYHIVSSDAYGIPEIAAYEDDILFDEENSEWSLPHNSVQDLFNVYFSESIERDMMTIDGFL